MRKKGIAWILAVIMTATSVCGMGTVSYAKEPVELESTQEVSEEEQKAYEESGEMIVKVDSQDDMEALEESLESDATVTPISDDYALVEVTDSENVMETVSELQDSPYAGQVQPNIVYQIQDEGGSAQALSFDADTLNDKYYKYEWWASGESFTVKYRDGSEETISVNPNAAMNLKEAWASYVGIKPVTVAVIDTGIDIGHEDLTGVIWTNQGEIPDNGLDDDGNGYVDDVYGWDFYKDDNTVNDKRKFTYYDEETNKSYQAYEDDHGTHVAGIIAANANNSVGIAGVASNCNVKIMPVKALGGKNGTTNTAKLINAIQYAENMGADVVNASWAGESGMLLVDEALYDTVKNCGMLFVCAAGNEGKNLDSKRVIPACYSNLSNVITVGAIDPDGTKASYSNYGSYVNLFAPGTDITSSVVEEWNLMSGTSMASPMVAGIAAMIYSYRDDLSPSVVKKYLLSHTKSLSTLAAGSAKITGVPDAKAVVDDFSTLDGAKDMTAPVIGYLRANYKGVVTATVKDNGTGVARMRIAKGERTASYFKNGMKGSKFSGSFQVKSSGTYTLYAMDYSRNETVKSIRVTVDKTAPNVGIKVNGKKAVITVKDNASGVSKVRYAKGKHGTTYFSASGKNVSLSSSKATLRNLAKGTYTLYAEDKVGNEKVKTFTIN
ncbi:MAG: S8 family peptidase [Clostridiales bacterium]|nr:S8 family peptidase [Clostridiales bacterium]